MLKAPEDINSEFVIPEEITEMLESTAQAPNVINTPQGVNKFDEARRVFDRNNASLDRAASTIAGIMSFGEKDTDKLKAAELVLRVQGITKEVDEKTIPQIIVNVQGSENKTLINLVLPSV